MSTTSVYAIYDFEAGGIYYSIIGGNEVMVTAGMYGDPEYSGHVNIPATVYHSGVTYTVAMIDVGAFYDSGITSVTIPNTIRYIGADAFNSCGRLTSIPIPNSVITIGVQAFKGCSSLTSVTIPSSVTEIGTGAFCYCSELTSFIFNAVKCTSDGRDIFYECPKLTNITIGDGVKVIPPNFFNNCISLTSITIPSSITSIGYFAFFCCSGLTSVTIPASVAEIGEYAFSGCFELTSIEVSAGNTIYDSREGCNAIIETATNTLVSGCMNTTIPASVTSIGAGAFLYCCNLASVTIPNSVTSIGRTAFGNCSGLTSITIPNSVSKIGEHVFTGCSNLESVTSLSTTPPECADASVFDAEVYESATLYVPERSKADYESAFVWQDFSKIEGISDSGVDDAAADALGISTADGAISVAGSDAPMQVYDLSGKRVWQGPASQGARLARGIYLVRVSDTITKVAL